MGNDWFYEYFINELKAIGKKPTSNMQHEVVDSLPSSGNEQTIYFVKNDSSSSDNHYDEYVWISSSSTFEKIGSSQIDGSAANPDWNQNDATQPDYVKNRPFYTGDPVETVLVEATTIPFEYTKEGFYAGGFETTFVPTVGETYKVSWDGTAYECTCISVNNTPVIGNLSIVGPDVGSDTGEPFLFILADSGGFEIATADTASSHTFSISGTVIPVVKIDENYLPDTVATKSDVEAAQTAANNAVSYASYQQLTDAQKQQARTNIGAGTSSFSGSWNDLTDKPLKPAGESYLTFSSPNRFTLAVKNAIKRWDGTLEYFTSDGTWTTWNANGILSAIPYYSEYVLYLRGTGNTIITGNISGSYWVLTGTDIKCIGNIENLLDYATVESGAHPTLANNCYYQMFYGCTSLTEAPTLPATTLADYCYYQMFRGCTSLTQAPALPATTLADYCYYQMFYGCTSLTEAPALPATTLANNCYQWMFKGCTSLTEAPTLPATTLADTCYYEMFSGCASLTQAPALPATTLAKSCYQYMFRNCPSLKLSSTKNDEYTQEYRIPSSGDGTTATDALLSMFDSTGGTFTGTPSVNTTYYLSSDNMIVRETEIATLNGYVDSMINAAIGWVTTLHVNVTAVNKETMEATFTADKTPNEMEQASVNGPIWCVITFAAGVFDEGAVSFGVPPAWYGGSPAFGEGTAAVHGDDGSNKTFYVVRQGLSDTWILDLSTFGS